MEFSKDCKVWLACSKESARFPGMSHVQLVRDASAIGGGPALVATDGRRLVVVGVDDMLPEETEGPVTVEAMKAAAKVKRAPLASIVANGSLRVPLAGVEYARPEHKPDDFPRYTAAIPGDTRSRLVVGLNAHYLSEIAEALGSDGVVRLEIDVQHAAEAPIVVRTCSYGSDRRLGVLMPVTVGGDDVQTAERVARANAYAAWTPAPSDGTVTP